ncbi:MAG: transposase [Methylocella sp.]
MPSSYPSGEAASDKLGGVDAALRQRGSLTVWFSEEAIAGWKASPRTTRGGQPLFSNMAIQTGLILRTVFGLARRQTEGLLGSIIHLLG